MAHATFQVGNLTAVIGDNLSHDQHRAGYNGIFPLYHLVILAFCLRFLDRTEGSLD
jgi:hypothetical protein